MTFDPASMMTACRTGNEVYVREHMDAFLAWLKEVMEAGTVRASKAETQIEYLKRRLAEAHQDRDFYLAEMLKLQGEVAEMKKERQTRPGRMIEV